MALRVGWLALDSCRYINFSDLGSRIGSRYSTSARTRSMSCQSAPQVGSENHCSTSWVIQFSYWSATFVL